MSPIATFEKRKWLYSFVPAFVDITGKRFGRLVVIERDQNLIENGRKRVMWRCLCDCGTTHITRGHSLTSGHATSCGCFRVDELVRRGHERKDTSEETLKRRKQHRTKMAYDKVLANRYGLTSKDFRSMLYEQNNRCAICTLIMEPPYVDHNHTTGKVRKLLCRKCNWLLGMANENVIVLFSAIQYLETQNG